MTAFCMKAQIFGQITIIFSWSIQLLNKHVFDISIRPSCIIFSISRIFSVWLDQFQFQTILIRKGSNFDGASRHHYERGNDKEIKEIPHKV